MPIQASASSPGRGYADLSVRGWTLPAEGVAYSLINIRSGEYVSAQGWKIDRQWLEPVESSIRPDGSLYVQIGPDIVQHIPDIGNYKLEVAGPDRALAQTTVLRWDVDPPHDGDLEVYRRDLRERVVRRAARSMPQPPTPAPPVEPTAVIEPPVVVAPTPSVVTLEPTIEPTVAPSTVLEPPHVTSVPGPVPGPLPGPWVGDPPRESRAPLLAVAAVAVLLIGAGAAYFLWPGEIPGVSTGETPKGIVKRKIGNDESPCAQTQYTWESWMSADVSSAEARGCLSKWAASDCSGAEFATEYLAINEPTAAQALAAVDFYAPADPSDACEPKPLRARFWAEKAVARAKVAQNADEIERAEQRLRELVP